jgi:hypothetical protein
MAEIKGPRRTPALARGHAQPLAEGAMLLTRTPPENAVSIDPEQVCFMIIKAKEPDAKVEPDDPDSGSNPADDREIDILEDFADDSTLQELTEVIDTLNDDQRAELLAMVWIGRGDFEPSDWELALTEAAATADAFLASYLVGTPLLGDLLEEGYSQLGYSCEDYEINRL